MEEGELVQQVYIYIDDSGTFDQKNSYFIYGGYVFLDKRSKDIAKRKYKKLAKSIKDSLGVTGELKSYGLEHKHKRALYNVMKEEHSLSVTVDLNRVYAHIFEQNKSKHRYKDYALKRAIKGKVKQLISAGEIDANLDTSFYIFVDEQGTSTNGYYGLEESIKEEFQNGVANFDYGTHHPPIFNSRVNVQITYCDSKCHDLIQASDILANRVYCSYVLNKPGLRNLNNHFQLQLP